MPVTGDMHAWSPPELTDMRGSSIKHRLGKLWYGSDYCFRIAETTWPPYPKSQSVRIYVFFSIFFLLVCSFLLALLRSPRTGVSSIDHQEIPKPHPHRIASPLNCIVFNITRTCPGDYPTISPAGGPSPSTTCPEYFRWIHEDLRPWSLTGISREMVERGRRTANFKLIIANGKAYVQKYRQAFQTRDVFTLWGIMQLLRRYPGQVPNLELMFDCVDWPVVKSSDYRGPNSTAPPPLFRYCGDEDTLDIVFPDWSFWGWPEINIKPWGSLLSELQEGNKRSKWIEREPYAFWKGNPVVAPTRQDLMKCNVSEGRDWNVRVYAQDWIQESKRGYQQSDLAGQCAHRYKIYIEGSAWSVSEKYILACDSVTLLVKPHYYDFFTRSLVPVWHYWPIKEDDKCRAIKFAVDWGNRHRHKAHSIGKTASKFIEEELKMDFVYDYMLHLLSQYAKLLTFRPAVPPDAVLLCSEAMACQADGLVDKFMQESMVETPADTRPCALPPPTTLRPSTPSSPGGKTL